MATYSLKQFRSEVLEGAGLARTNRFEVDILPPQALSSQYSSISNLTSLYVEQTSIPALNIFTKQLKINGAPTYQRPITSEYGGEGLPITFHVDRNMNVRKFFEDWMFAVVEPDNFNVNYQSEYASTIVIRQLDEQDNITYEIELLEAFPRNLNLMDLNNASSNQTHRLNVLFAYRYWRRRVGTNNQDIPRFVLNPQVPTIDYRENTVVEADYNF